MLIVYVDESGDPFGDPRVAGSPAYTLGVVVIRDHDWADAFDAVINMRRRLKSTFAIPVRSEIKASYLVRNGGVFGGLRLSPHQRRYIYRQHLQILAPVHARAFAVHVDKVRYAERGELSHVRTDLWDGLFQRLSIMHDRDDGSRKSPVLLVHDEGEELTIRKLARKARRFLTSGSAFGPTSLQLSERWLIDDPVSRQSHHSYFVQLADLVAYAAAKCVRPGGARARRICPDTMWQELGSACHAPANELVRRAKPNLPSGIVIRPRPE